jgi:hypothetical protein
MLARRIDVHQAVKAVDGWAADSSLTYRDTSGRVCVLADYRGQSSSDADTMVKLLDDWKSVGPSTDASVHESGDTVAFTTCDPGKDVTLAGTDRSNDAIQFVSARIEIVEEFFKQHVPDSVARCSVNGMLGHLSLDDVLAIDNGTASTSLQQEAESALEKSVESCH